MKCSQCDGQCVRKGMRSGVQQYRCSVCGRYQRELYQYKAYGKDVDRWIVALVKESCGIRSIARLMGLSPTTVIARIKRIAKHLRPNMPIRMGRNYEVDELATYCRKKKNRVYLAYAFDRAERRVVSLAVGRRTKAMLAPVIATLQLADARTITTDGLDIYRTLIPTAIHRVKQFGINRIERHNLTLRTHLKRLARRTICYTKSLAMLRACAVIRCWG